MNKKFLSAVLAAALISSSMPAVIAAENVEADNIKVTASTDDKSAAYSLYLNNSAVYLADNGDDALEASEEPAASETPEASEEPAASETPSESKFSAYYNSKDEGYVTSVKDQILDGDCWAFAATSVFETSLLKKGLVNDAAALDLSEKHITDNTYANNANPWSYDYTSMGHSGVSTSYFSRGTGPVYDSGNGYDNSSYDASKYGVNTNLQSEFYVESIAKIPDLILWAVPVTEYTNNPDYYGGTIEIYGTVFTITNPDDITDEIRESSYIIENWGGYDLYKVGFYTQRDLIKEEILKNGSVYTTMSTSVNKKDEGDEKSYFENYFFNDEKNAFYNYNFTLTDHAVTIVGWDDNFSKDNFLTPPIKDGAWIVKNSWGNKQLDEGYMYVSYYDTKICEDIISITAAALGDTNKIFQYDIFGSTGVLRYGQPSNIDLDTWLNSELWALNRFENEKTEDQFLNKVGVYVPQPNTTCNIYASSNGKNTEDNIGGKTGGKDDNGFRDQEPIKTVKFELPGYYTVELDEPISIWGDFDVAVKYGFDDFAESKELTLAAEMPIENCSKATAKKGESYYAVDYGNKFKFKWENMSSNEAYYNACIKAFTTTKTSDDKYEVGSLSVTDMSGKALNTLPENGSFLVNTTVTKRKNRLQSDYLIIAAYDEKGAFLGFSYLLLEEGMKISDSRTFGAMIDVPAGKRFGSLKAFVWSSLSDNTPISNFSELKAESN